MSPSSPVSRSTPDRLRHSLLSQAGAHVFKLLVSIGIGGWTARYLGPQNLGTLSYVGALVGLLAPLGSLGVKGCLSAMLCDERPLPGLLGSALLIELLGTLVIAVVLIPVAWMARDPVVTALIGLAVTGNLFNSFEVFEVELLNRQRGTLLARLGTIQTIVGAFISILALLLQAPLLFFGSLPAFQAAIKACLLTAATQIAKPLRLLKQASWHTSRALVIRGWPLLLAGLSVSLYMKSDQVMLEWMRGPIELGHYSVAVRVAESLYFMPVILSQTLLPKIGRESGQLDLSFSLRQLYQAAWFLGVGMTLVSMLVLPLLIPLVFGDEYRPAQAAMIWLGPAAFAVSTGTASGTWLNTQGHQALIAQRSALGALLNIGMNLILIPRMGIAGAALATSVSYLASVYLIGAFRKDILSNLVYLVFPFRHGAFQS